jgi:small GTP-binding protein
MGEPLERIPFKAVLLGESGVGKTSIVTRWISGVFSKTIMPTIGANHQRKRIRLESVEIEMSVWDTAGQEEFHSLTPLYARAAAVAVLCTAIDSESSFQKMPVWMDLLKEANETIPPIVLVVNKIDIDLTNLAARQEEIIQKYSNQFNGLFFVSAVNNDGIDEMFHHVAEAGYRFMRASEPSAGPVAVDGAGESPKQGCC